MKQLARGTYTVRREISSHKRTQILKYRVSVIQNHVTENMTKKKGKKTGILTWDNSILFDNIYVESQHLFS